MKLQIAGDKIGIGLSMVCLVHCIALPLILVMFPSVILATLSDELFHQIMLFAILPVSLITLTIGFTHHKDKSVLAIGLLGLTFLTGTAFVDHDVMGEWAEIGFTVLGSAIIAYAHFRNTRKRHFFRKQDKSVA